MIDFEELLELQKVLDKRIFEKFNLTEIETFNKRKLALIVELAELANETRSFKFWSLKAPSSKEIILDEYADCLHFFLSIGITLNIDFRHIIIENEENDLNSLFIMVFNKVSNLIIDDSNLFLKAFNLYLKIGLKLGFSVDDIKKAYLSKNKINHDRQNNNY